MKMKFPLGTEGGDLSETKQITLSVPRAIYSSLAGTSHRTSNLTRSNVHIAPNTLCAQSNLLKPSRNISHNSQPLKISPVQITLPSVPTLPQRRVPQG